MEVEIDLALATAEAAHALLRRALGAIGVAPEGVHSY